jgi:PAS domain-containing protein
MSKKKELKISIQNNILAKNIKKLSTVGLWCYDVKLDKMTWSDESYFLFEKFPNDYFPTLNNFVDNFVPEHKIIMKQGIDQLINQGNEYLFEVQIITLTGKNLWIKTTGSCVREKGQIVSLNGIFFDIDEQKKFEVEARKSVIHLNLAKEVSNIGQWDYRNFSG